MGTIDQRKQTRPEVGGSLLGTFNVSSLIIVTVSTTNTHIDTDNLFGNNVLVDGLLLEPQHINLCKQAAPSAPSPPSTSAQPRQQQQQQLQQRLHHRQQQQLSNHKRSWPRRWWQHGVLPVAGVCDPGVCCWGCCCDWRHHGNLHLPLHAATQRHQGRGGAEGV